jgi:sterol 3beta-glucosyltransferase
MRTPRSFADGLPERFRDDDDSQVDYTAPPRSMGPRDGNMHYMQQSLFGMIAAVGSRSDFRTRFDDSSDSDGETEVRPGLGPIPSPASRQESREKSLTGKRSDSLQQTEPEERGRRHRRTISEDKPLRKFPVIGSSEKDDDLSAMSGSTILIPPRRTRSATPRAAPVLARMVQAQNRFDTATTTEETPLRPETPSEEQQKPSASALSTRLMEMFEFDRPETVLVEYACSLVQSMLLQGYMYVTEGHICFYAYLPKKSSLAIKSGYLSKRGRNNPKYNRYWFVLKGDVFSYYADPSNLYFPSGHVDLRYGISASLAEPKTKGAEVKDFQVTTDQRTYYFRADSATSAKEWVKGLQKVIFRTHNEGDSVKVSFPIRNVIDLEESPMTEFAETFKIRVIDSSETYAIDEVIVSLPPKCYLGINLTYSTSFVSSTRGKMPSIT